MLTTNRRTKLLILSDDREIAITEDQYKAIKADQALGRFSDPITIRDLDTKEILFDGKIGAIKEFRDIKSSYSGGDRWICDFWIRHVMSESCGCPDKYKVIPIDFRIKMYELYPRMYAKNLSTEQRKIILENITL